MLLLKFNEIIKKMPRGIAALFLADIALCIAYIIDVAMDSPCAELSRLLDLNGESSVASWYSSMQLFCVCIVSGIFSHQNFKKNRKSCLLVCLPILFLLMSIDESVQIHEWLALKSDVLLSEGGRIGTSFRNTGIWMFVIGIPFLIIFLLFACSLRQFFSHNLSSLLKLVAGMIIMLIGALGFETISNFVGGTFWHIEVCFEEGLEMVGVTVMLWAIYDVTAEYLPGLDQRTV